MRSGVGFRQLRFSVTARQCGLGCTGEKEDVDLSDLRTGVVGDGFRYVERGIFAPLASGRVRPIGGYVLGGQVARTDAAHETRESR